MDGAGWFNTFIRIEVPQIAPDLFSVIGSGLALNFKLMVAAEVLTATMNVVKLLTNKKDECLAILVDPSFTSNEAYQKIVNLCKNTNIKIIVDNKILSKIKDKGNIFVIGVFKKYQSTLSNNKLIPLFTIDNKYSKRTCRSCYDRRNV